MGVSSAVFETAGKRTEHYVPGVYSRQNNVTTPSGVSVGNLCILGESQGGASFELLEFSSLADAKNSLVSGDLLNAVAYAFNGSREYAPQKVYAMRVGASTQSSLTMQNGETDLLKIKSWDYGSHTNQLKMWVKSGSADGSKVITTVFKDEKLTTDDIIQASLNIVYVGDGTAPTVSISKDAMTLTHTVDEQSESVSISFAEYSTLATLAARINDTGNFSANVLDTDTQAESAYLDTVSSTSVEEAVTFYSNFHAFVEELEANPYVGEVEILNESVRTMPNVTTGYAYFTGGTTAVAGVSDYVTALEQLETQDIQIIATSSTDNSVHNLIVNHCSQMSSTVNRKERTCLLGGSTGESDDEAIEKALGFNSELCSYVVDSAICTNPLSGSTETVSGAIVAVMLAGMESGMSPNESLTNKELNVLGFSKTRTIPNMEKLIKKGILVCNADPEDMTRFVCIRALTTYQKSDLIYNERSMVRESFVMNRELRNYYKPLIGRTGTLRTSDFINALKGIAEKWAAKGYIVPNDSNEDVWDISVKIDGDKVYITYSRYLTAPINFVFITAINHVYTSTTEVA